MKRIVLALLVACGGSEDPELEGSGVEATLPSGTLTAAQISDVCAYGVSLSREVVCNGNPTQSVTVLEACIGLLETLSDNCVATVADLEVCFEDSSELTDDEICALATPDSCGFLGDPSCIDV